jgi:prepilin-type processing-associated H-X9-DG protein
MPAERTRHGFTLIQVAVCVAVLGVLLVFFANAIVPCHCGNRQLRDSTQIRGIVQGMVIWAQNHKDLYPLPSVLDLADATVPEKGPAKDTTANIMSILVFEGLVAPEALYNPAEASSSIRVDETYEYDRPKAAVDPERALWDPALSADFTSPSAGNISYAHIPPTVPRLAFWSAASNADGALLGDRGPQVSAATPGRGASVVPTLANPKSVTFLIHGGGHTWKGNTAFHDGHVALLTTLHAGNYTTTGGTERNDLLFYDEPDDPKGTNAFLGIFIRAGPDPKDFKSIWD